MDHNPKTCVCTSCCDARLGSRKKPIHEIRVMRPTRKMPPVGEAGKQIRAFGWQVTRFVYGTAFCVFIVAICISLAR